jgi:hypothetical protein
MRLYRVVSPAELADIRACGRLRQGPNSLEGKWFAERLQDAMIWARDLYTLWSQPFHIIEVEVANPVADSWHQAPFQDQIGPARYAEAPDLSLITVIGEVP